MRLQTTFETEKMEWAEHDFQAWAPMSNPDHYAGRGACDWQIRAKGWRIDMEQPMALRFSTKHHLSPTHCRVEILRYAGFFAMLDWVVRTETSLGPMFVESAKSMEIDQRFLRLTGTDRLAWWPVQWTKEDKKYRAIWRID